MKGVRQTFDVTLISAVDLFEGITRQQKRQSSKLGRKDCHFQHYFLDMEWLNGILSYALGQSEYTWCPTFDEQLYVATLLSFCGEESCP